MSVSGKYQELDLKRATVLLTGGASGIGLGLAEQFLKAGSTVIITGRRESALREAQEKLPDLKTRVADSGSAAEREKLAKWIVQTYPDLNILVNNAGIQRRVALVEDTDWSARQLEIDINCSGPVHLAGLLTPHLLKQPEAAIVNITSGLGILPCAFAPTYGATKAFMHSWTVAARPHYSKTNIHIVEIAPPAVRSNLGGSHDYGEPTDEFCENVFSRFARGEKEIGFRASDEWRTASREGINEAFDNMTEKMFYGKYQQYNE